MDNAAPKDSLADSAIAYAALCWQLECGVDAAVCETPTDRYKAASLAVAAAPAPQPEAPSAPPISDPVAFARAAAQDAQSLEELRAALGAFTHCDVRNGARHTVFADGNPAARVMVIGEAPGRDEDIQGIPFVGAAGQLLDRMFASIGLARHSAQPESALYITNVLPWRPPGNRPPEPDEMTMMQPFLERHIALADPEIIVAMGNTPLSALTGQRGILKARGHWFSAQEIPVLAMLHPAYLLRNPAAKREAWSDLLELQARLRQIKPAAPQNANEPGANEKDRPDHAQH